ncbi:MAG: glycosyltransferase [Acidimicrobiales bacterium]|nr:glycosyltransferase [Acidimicrobiales bacterium]
MTSPVRVLHLLKGLGPGGAERLVVAQATANGASTRQRVAYLVPAKDHLVPELQAAGVRVDCLESASAARLGWMGRLRRLLRTDPVDVLHIHSPALAAIGRLLVRTVPRAARPVVVGTEHNRWPRHHRLTRLANRLTIRFEAATIAVSADVASTIRGASSGQVRVIEHGIDTRAVMAAADRNGVRAELGLAADDVVVACVANLRREKSLDVLVEAARLACRDDDRLRYVLIGQGPLADELDGWIAAADLGDRFRALGYRSDAPRVLSGADIFTLSSTHEGLPVAMMEAMALGLPVAATDAGGVADGAGDAGLICAVGDAAALAANHVQLASDETLRSRLGAAASARAAHFSIDRAVGEIEAVYAEATATPAR